jgi:lipoprotein-releasing system permease protein
MNAPFEWTVGWRYTRAGRASRRDGFISFISLVSMVGIALGVAALIIVLSVMNGFQREVRDRMLSVIAHVELYDVAGNGFDDWQAVAAKAKQADASRVIAAAPFIANQALLARGDTMRGALVRGIEPDEEAKVTPLAAKLRADTLDTLKPGAWHIVLGSELARELGVRVGDSLTIATPGGQVSPVGALPRTKQFKVSGTFDSGHYQYDSTYALIHLDDAQRLYRHQGPTGVQLKINDQQAAREVSERLTGAMGDGITVTDWTRTNRNWYDAVQVEKRMMSIILTLIVAVAAFNLVSMLVMTVTDKQADIAILRTLGASPRSIMGIFMVQGAAAGVMGTLAGVALGLLTAFNIDTIVRVIERLLNRRFLPPNLYVIDHMPSDPQRADILTITLIALLLAFLATLYPSWRASRTNPAQALRYE